MFPLTLLLIVAVLFYNSPVSAQQNSKNENLSESLPGVYINLPVPSETDMNQTNPTSSCPSSMNISKVKSRGGKKYEINIVEDLELSGDSCTINENASPFLDLTWVAETQDSDSYWIGYSTNLGLRCKKSGLHPGLMLLVTSARTTVKLLVGGIVESNTRTERKEVPWHHQFAISFITLGKGSNPESTMSCLLLTAESRAVVLKQWQALGAGTMNESLNNEDPKPGTSNEPIFSQICTCLDQFPSKFDVRRKADVILTDMINQPSKININGMNFGNSSICQKDESFSLQELVAATSSSQLSGIPPPVQNLLQEALKQVYAEQYEEEFTNDSAKLKPLNESLSKHDPNHRRIVLLGKGPSCGFSEVGDHTILLFEYAHPLVQLRRKAIMRDFSIAQIRKVLSKENWTQSFILHAFQGPSSDRVARCIYTLSDQAVALLSPKCKSNNLYEFSYINEVKDLVWEDKPRIGKDKNDEKNEDDHITFHGSQEGSGREPEGPTTTPGPSVNSYQSENSAQTVSESSKPTAMASITPSSPTTSSASPSTMPSAALSPSNSPALSSTSSPSESVTPSPFTEETTGLGLSCFPSAAKVELVTGRFVQMDELKVGQAVRDISGGFSTIVLFAHSDHTVMGLFVHLHSANGDIVVSPSHYLYVNGGLKVASQVRVGDTILVNSGGHGEHFSMEPVLDITTFTTRGLFNPQTTSGSIAVTWSSRAVVASTYTSAIHPQFAHRLLWPLVLLDTHLHQTFPFISWFFVSGSQFWGKMIPSGPAHLEL